MLSIVFMQHFGTRPGGKQYQVFFIPVKKFNPVISIAQ